jgi:SAM-dependent methyltransferase
VKLDLACGPYCAEGYEGVDCRPLPGVAWIVDLTEYPWPWQSDSVDALRCSHYVEHVVDLVAFMNECHRILRPDGLLEIVHPYQHSDRAWQDPTHVRALNFSSWDYYNAAALAELGDEFNGITADFATVEKEAIISPELAAHYPEGVPDFMIFHCVNVINDLRIVLRKR